MKSADVISALFGMKSEEGRNLNPRNVSATGQRLSLYCCARLTYVCPGVPSQCRFDWAKRGMACGGIRWSGWVNRSKAIFNRIHLSTN